jgi:hypothetical protein
VKNQKNTILFLSIALLALLVLVVACIDDTGNSVENQPSTPESYEIDDIFWATEGRGDNYKKPSQDDDFILPPVGKDIASDDISPAPQILESKTRYNIMQLLQLVGNNVSEVIDVFGKLPELASPYAGVYICDEVYFYVDTDTLSTIVMIALSADLCEIDGVSLDRNRDELINVFGTPISEWHDEEGSPYYYGLILDFEIQNRFARFILRTSYENAELMKIFSSLPPKHYWRGQ